MGYFKKHWALTKTKGKVTEITNVIKVFYTLPDTTMWITFFQRKLFWCFASSETKRSGKNLPDLNYKSSKN